MTPPNGQLTLLPPQLDRLAKIGNITGAAIAISQSGSVIRIDPGNDSAILYINAEGRYINKPRGASFAEEDAVVHEF